MVIGLLCRWGCDVCCYLYPAYASYKALSLHPGSSPEAVAQVERWLMYWAVVGSWTAVESLLGWAFTWLPFYSFVKTILLLSLSLPQSEASSYVYKYHLAPLFKEHERDIDSFLTSLSGRATESILSGVAWVWQKVKVQLNASCFFYLIPLSDEQLQAAAVMTQQGQGQSASNINYPIQDVHQPPTLSDPASGAMQSALHLMSRYAGQYMPAALTAFSAAAASVSARNQDQNNQSPWFTSDTGYTRNPSTSMSIPVPTGPTAPVHQPQSDSSLRSRTYAHASGSTHSLAAGGQETYPMNSMTELQQAQYAALASARAPPPGFGPSSYRSFSSPSAPPILPGNRSSPQSRSNASSESLSSRNDGYEQIGKDELQDMNQGKPGMESRKSWFGWSGAPPDQPKDKNE
nr:hypothetical protein L204_04054 [Cryptococcus depauperatus CBS 7855]